MELEEPLVHLYFSFNSNFPFPHRMASHIDVSYDFFSVPNLNENGDDAEQTKHAF